MFNKKINFGYYYLFIITYFFSFACFLYSSDDIYNSNKYYDEGSAYLNTGVELDYLYNALKDGWYKTESYKYQNSQTRNSINSSYLDSLLTTEAYLNYNKNLKAMALFDVYGSEYNSLWRPINDVNKKWENNQYISLKQVEINLKDYFYHLRYFQGVPHYNWKNEGDLFYFYPEQFETDKYLNISGRPVPQGVELDYSFDTLGALKVIYGEPIWGNRDSVYAKYNFDIAYFKNYFLYKREKLVWQASYGDQYKESYAFTSNIEYLLPFDVSFGIMYQPFRVGVNYDYINEVSPGQGDYGTKYKKKISTTTDEDAVGYALGLKYIRSKIFDNIALNYKYLNILAGDKQEVNLLLDKNFFSKFLFNFSALYRKPIIGANPLIYEGSSTNSMQIYSSPRGEESPFWVNQDNREKTSIDFTLSYFSSIFNPTNLFNYDMGKLEDWNLNKKDTSIFDCAFSYCIEQYPTSTDRQYYYDQNGNVIWENLGSSGLYAIDKLLNSYSFFCKGRLNTKLNYSLLLKTGDTIALGSSPYAATSIYTPITRFWDTNLSMSYRTYKINLNYSKNNWGPEDWQRTFGLVYSNLYKIELSKDFGNFGVWALSYLDVLQDNYKTEKIEIPSFEEIMLKWNYNFERLFLFKEKKKKLKIVANINNKIENKSSPQIFTSIVDNNIVTFNDDGLNDSIKFGIEVKTETNIDKWAIIIADAQNDNIIFKKEGLGEVPSFFEWKPTIKDGIKYLETGKYYMLISVSDILSNSSESNKLFFEISTKKSILNRNILDKLTMDNKVLIKETIGSLSFNYKIEDIYNSVDKIPDDAIIKLLKEILNNDNIYKIKIFTYITPSTKITDKNIVKTMSNNIAKSLATYGVNSQLIETFVLTDTNLKQDSVEIVCYYN